MSEGRVALAIEGPVARMTFDRPGAMNAMTWSMYDELDAHCRALADAPDIRAVVLRGAGGRAFVAGTDIAQFNAFGSADDGVAYEARMDQILDNLAAIPAPTVAAIDGLAVGGGLNIAARCDIRIATRDARFGAPIARTLGNCLSMKNYAGMLAVFGEARAKRMLLLGELLDVDEISASGFLAAVVAPDAMEEAVGKLVSRLLSNAPLSMRASKAALARLAASGGGLPDGGDLIRSCYGGADFREGVRAFGEKRKPKWGGS